MTLQPIGLIFPDVELWASTYLRDALAARDEVYTWGVYVSNRIPAPTKDNPQPRKDRMVIVRRDGGNSTGLRDQARLSVQVWAKTDQDATDLARLVAALLWAAPTGDPVLKVQQQSGPTPIADNSQQPLRYLVFDVHTRGTPI